MAVNYQPARNATPQTFSNPGQPGQIGFGGLGYNNESSPSDFTTNNPYAVQVDPATMGNINEQGAKAEDPSLYPKTMMQGVSPTGSGLLRPESQVAQDTQSLGMQTPSDLTTSLSRRTEQNYDSAIKALDLNARANGPMYQMNLLGQQVGNLSANEAIRLANYQMANKQYEQTVQVSIAQQMANNNELASILGLIGTGIGAVVGSIIPGVGTAIGAGAGAVIGGGVASGVGKLAGSKPSVPSPSAGPVQ